MAHLEVNSKSEMIVTDHAMHVYLPAHYKDTAYRGEPYYSMLGAKAKYLGVGWIRFFKDDKELADFANPKNRAYPLGLPILITSEPATTDMVELQFSVGGPKRKVIVLTFYKGDRFLINTHVIKNSDAVMMELAQLDQGKRDMYLPEVTVGILRDCQSMNGLSLRIPSEEEEIFIVQKYRDPTRPSRNYRFHEGKAEGDQMISYNSRMDVMKNTTFQAVFGEDFNTAAIVSINKSDRGEIDEPSAFESLVRGMSMDEYAERDHPSGEEHDISPYDDKTETGKGNPG